VTPVDDGRISLKPTWSIAGGTDLPEGDARWQDTSRAPGGPPGGSGGGMSELPIQVAKLEQRSDDFEGRIVRFETKLDSLVEASVRTEEKAKSLATKSQLYVVAVIQVVVTVGAIFLLLTRVIEAAPK